MRVEGNYSIAASPERVWTILMDPAFLQLAIPGCEEMEMESPNVYRVKIKAGVAAIRTSFTGQVRLEDLRKPAHYRMVTTAQGAAGFVNGAGEIDLAADGAGTTVRYVGEVQVGGMLAAVGSRMVEAAFRKSAADFFNAVSDAAGRSR